MKELKKQYKEGHLTFAQFVFEMLLSEEEDEDGKGKWWVSLYDAAVEEMKKEEMENA